MYYRHTSSTFAKDITPPGECAEPKERLHRQTHGQRDRQTDGQRAIWHLGTGCPEPAQAVESGPTRMAKKYKFTTGLAKHLTLCFGIWPHIQKYSEHFEMLVSMWRNIVNFHKNLKSVFLHSWMYQKISKELEYLPEGLKCLKKLSDVQARCIVSLCKHTASRCAMLEDFATDQPHTQIPTSWHALSSCL